MFPISEKVYGIADYDHSNDCEYEYYSVIMVLTVAFEVHEYGLRNKTCFPGENRGESLGEFESRSGDIRSTYCKFSQL